MNNKKVHVELIYFNLFISQEFMIFFGLLYILTTTLFVVFKEEKPAENSENELSLVESYHLVWKIFCLKPIQLIVFVVISLRVNQTEFNLNFYL